MRHVIAPTCDRLDAILQCSAAVEHIIDTLIVVLSIPRGDILGETHVKMIRSSD